MGFPIQHDASGGHWKTTEPAEKNMRQSPRPSKKTLTFGCTLSDFKHLLWRGQRGGQRHVAIGNRLASLFPIQHDASGGHWKTTEPAKKNMRQSPRPSKKDSDFWVHTLEFQAFAMEGAKGWPASC